MATTTKRKRKYSQDFSGNSLTDQSFAPGCDVNNIVRHYQETGIDPNPDRKKMERYGEASTLTYEDAMRNKAELDSYTLENPDWDAPQPEPEAPEAEITPDPPPDQPAPQDASGGDSA
jgi:hypothetical protein